ncbi:hypothetical protein BGLT_06322 [Caballeronia glathei]|jgi:hypothetical protein|uniref:Transcriptional regulator n=1 Tax=Caballeronia glathei TaxID=60547 RepID=A0A069Q307_9BURK|nr:MULTISPECIES: hypothetical protein [Burkholderiaceae]KDR44136.1 hypothetical protein BG61_18865 [Caballeronia glathei]TCK34716.1 hypothetical protein B0G84_6675 [Paraburkholderia sp. BL8N3]CDY77409.1 hypothetical protein BGLT_06322 [Caballeronia glathei]
MRFDYKTFHIDCRARHDEDGRYYARATITEAPPAGRAHGETHDSGELDAFPNESDALHCARAWALEWCDEIIT